MAHSNSTQYYNLPQFESTDKPAWLVDVNPAYAAIDTGIHAAKAAADAAQSDATQALTDAGTAGTTANTADAKATGAIASIADAFDATSTYTVGDYVVYNSLLYICTVAVTTPGPWTGSANWTRATIENEVNDVNTALGARIDGIINDSSASAASTYSSNKIDSELGATHRILSANNAINIPIIGVSDIANRIICFVNLPFIAGTTAYNVSVSSVNLVGKGIFTSDIQVDSKNNGGFYVIITNVTSAAGSVYGGLASVTITI